MVVEERAVRRGVRFSSAWVMARETDDSGGEQS